MNNKYKAEQDLYKHTLLLNEKQDKLIHPYCSARCVRSTILNRTYYSAYLYVKKYLISKDYEIKDINYYKRQKKKFKTEHQQVIDYLTEENEELSSKLKILKNLRNKADYHPKRKITIKDITTSVNYMKDIFKELQIENKC